MGIILPLWRVTQLNISRNRVSWWVIIVVCRRLLMKIIPIMANINWVKSILMKIWRLWIRLQITINRLLCITIILELLIITIIRAGLRKNRLWSMSDRLRNFWGMGAMIKLEIHIWKRTMKATARRIIKVVLVLEIMLRKIKNKYPVKLLLALD